MLSYTMDVEPSSLWLRTTPSDAALAQPYYCTEAGLFYARKNFVTSRSSKNSYLIFYTISGEGWVKQGSHVVSLTPGTIFFMNCRIPQSYGTATKTSKWHHYWVHADGLGVKAMEPLLNSSGKPAAIEIPSTIRDQFDTIISVLTNENTESAITCSLAVHQILSKMASISLGDALYSGESNRELMEQAAKYIRAHAEEPLTLSRLLSIVHISKSYFMKLFRQYMGTTPYNFLLRYRITQAKELLEMTSLPIGEIASKVGFNDDCNFSTRFTAIVGQSPLQYRKNSIQVYTTTDLPD